MNFYYRSLPEGRCEVVCTRCFVTVGAGREIEDICRLESRHCCLAKSGAAREAPAPLGKPRVTTLPRPVQEHIRKAICGRRNKVRSWRIALLLAAAVLFLYGLPTALEFAALRSWDPWVAVIIPGDLAGCAFLILVFRKAEAGIALYFLLTALEACLYYFHITPLRILPWIVDVVPTLIVSAIILRASNSSDRPITIP